MPEKDPQLDEDYISNVLKDIGSRLVNTLKGQLDRTLPGSIDHGNIKSLLDFANGMVDRVNNALELAFAHGQNEEIEHKAWVIDQMVRALLGCPHAKRRGRGSKGTVYFYHVYGESEEYSKLVAQHRKGEDGPETYKWDQGVPP